MAEILGGEAWAVTHNMLSIFVTLQAIFVSCSVIIRR